MKNWIGKLDTIGLTVIAAALVVYSVRSIWTGFQTAAVAAGTVMVLAALVAKRERIRAGVSRRSTRYGANSVVSVLIFAGILGLVNYLGVRHQARYDLTAGQIYSLSEQSLNVADQVTENVRIRAFYPDGDDPAVRDLLDLYGRRSPRITYEFVDPDRQPQLAAQFDVTVYGAANNPLTGQTTRSGTLVLESGGFQERIEKSTEPLSEQDLTNALMRLVQGERKKIYFIEGHGERLIGETAANGLDAARRALERENYVVETLNLVRVEAVPADASVVVWPGPQTEPLPGEVEQVHEYLTGGGSALILVDPPPAIGLGNLLERWSVSAGENFVVDASGVGRLLGAGPEIPLVTDYGTHPVTRPLSGVMTFFPLARTVSAVPETVNDVAVAELLRTSVRSWGETAGFSEVEFNPEQDVEGPVSLGVAVTGPAGESGTTRLIAIGDSDFAANAYFGQAGNRNLFLNAVAWLAEDENFISIRPKAPDDRSLTLTESQGRVSFYISLVLLPLAILVAGISVWMKRRSQ